jgi:hypothetical protein
MNDFVKKVYEAAANAGFLKECVWLPSDGGPASTHMVGLKASDETVLDQLAATTETTMSYPAEILRGLSSREVVEIEGVRFQVRQIHPVGDGSEMHAKLTRVSARASPSVPPST